MTNEIIYRFATEEDVEKLLKMLSKFEYVTEEISGGAEAKELIVAIERGGSVESIVGYIYFMILRGYKKPRGYIYINEVLPLHRRRGVASNLIAVVEKEMVEKGIKLIMSGVTNNPNAEDLFLRLGYKPWEDSGKFFKILRKNTIVKPKKNISEN